MMFVVIGAFLSSLICFCLGWFGGVEWFNRKFENWIQAGVFQREGKAYTIQEWKGGEK